jgi:hypothetical protein
MYRVGGKLVRETLGTAAVIPNVADARMRARESLQKAQAGVNPVEERRGSEQAAQLARERAPKTFGAIVDLYLNRYAEKSTKISTHKEPSAS